NRARADGAPAPPASGPVERVVGRQGGYASSVSLDHPVGTHEYRVGHGDPKRSCGRQADHETYYLGLLNRKITRLCTLENLVAIGCRPSPVIGDVLAIAHQHRRFSFDIVSVCGNRRNLILQRKFRNLSSLLREEWVKSNNEGLSAISDHR